ncbi:recombinase family protein [Agrobacterium rubi]|uniref:recombinase family protein n=1 Tax=Agrobacterium rubi TaxID=28099 RepID=UPI002355CBC4|nr:recombinase family protein [Agrobacterium rubi]
MKAYSYVRISSKGQMKGDGVRRQVEASHAYAAANGLTIDEELTDIGLSGYHGDHVATGALGGFLELVKTGKIDKGSVLIVESLDRLSREDIITAQSQLMSLLAAGVDVVTLIDNQRYSRSASLGDIVLSLVSMARANEESRTKSERAKAKIAQRRTDAMNGKKTFVLNGPSWIDQIPIGGGQYRFELNERAQTVRDIFEMYDSGIGAHTISKILNAEKRPVFASRGVFALWRDASIMFFLRSEAAIGTYAIGTDFKVPDYYPRLVSDEVWFRIQDRLSANKTKAAGRRGEKFTNLFQGFAVCHNCGTPIRTIRGGNKNAYAYYACQQKFIGGSGCDQQGRKFIRLEAIEEAILDHVHEYHTDSKNGSVGQRENVAMELDSAKAESAEVAKRITNVRSVLETVDNDDDRLAFMGRLSELRKESERHNHTVAVLEKKLREIDENNQQQVDVNKLILDEIRQWPTMDKDTLYRSRAKINQSLSKIISTVRFDLPAKEAYVFVGGMTKAWRINDQGELTGQLDWSHIPWSVLETFSKNELGIDKSKLRDAKAINASIEGSRLPEELFGKHLTGR